ncbi:uncharacterized protein AMSG_05015 [Thecamonas trahens ATCC 50062]|uniref:Protein kinase domain-containing protein n=1 Tax=Thecamonas trahens ATCC 50062 TaxID=461836 RepID=A0A0L0DAE7_THETB|nr:hypothetical protein AMSG_05015 [Thecamonas trahens ATCC 50062]KNC49056.1 hypothetical protein AMSG_05015 [Thecamonas trahens ATCC 50062]|eukprot:XP_013758089.1 hypothetical protein AMSG_05015 [Thecamonas trahens ATCC 50062]
MLGAIISALSQMHAGSVPLRVVLGEAHDADTFVEQLVVVISLDDAASQRIPRSLEACMSEGIAEAKVRIAEAKVGVAEAKVDEAEAKVDEAETRVDKAEAMVGVAEAEIRVAKAKVGVAEARHEAVIGARHAGVATDADVAEAKVGVAEAKVGVAEARHEAVIGARHAGVATDADVAEAKVDVAEAKIGVAEAKVVVLEAKLREATACDASEAEIESITTRLKLASQELTHASPANEKLHPQIGIIQPHGAASKSRAKGFASHLSPVSDPAALYPLLVTGHLKMVGWPEQESQSPSASSGALSVADLASGPEDLGSGAAASPPTCQFVELDHNVALGMFSRVGNLQAATQKAVRDITQSLWPLTFHLERTFLSELTSSLYVFLRDEISTPFRHRADLDKVIASATSVERATTRLAAITSELAQSGSSSSRPDSNRRATELLAAMIEAEEELTNPQLEQIPVRVTNARESREDSHDPSSSDARSADAVVFNRSPLRTWMWVEHPVLRNAQPDVLWGLHSQQVKLGFGIFEPGSSSKGGQVEAYASALGLAAAGYPAVISILSLSGSFPTPENSGANISLQLAAHLVGENQVQHVAVGLLKTDSLTSYVDIVAGFAVSMSEVTQIMVKRLADPSLAPQQFGPNVAVVAGFVFKWFRPSSCRWPNLDAWTIASPELRMCLMVVDKAFTVLHGPHNETVEALPGHVAVVVTKAVTDVEVDDTGVTTAHFDDVAARLKKLHAAGIVHGDVRRSNIVFGNNGKGYLIDFDLARPVGTVYPARLRVVRDGSRAPGCVNSTAIMAVAHDVFALGGVMELYQAVDNGRQSEWIALVESLKAEEYGAAVGKLPSEWPSPPFLLQRTRSARSKSWSRGTGSP